MYKVALTLNEDVYNMALRRLIVRSITKRTAAIAYAHGKQHEIAKLLNESAAKDYMDAMAVAQRIPKKIKG
jgi:hypothetical protein